MQERALGSRVNQPGNTHMQNRIAAASRAEPSSLVIGGKTGLRFLDDQRPALPPSNKKSTSGTQKPTEILSRAARGFFYLRGVILHPILLQMRFSGRFGVLGRC